VRSQGGEGASVYGDRTFLEQWEWDDSAPLQHVSRLVCLQGYHILCCSGIRLLISCSFLPCIHPHRAC
jgi:hypothetical protein